LKFQLNRFSLHGLPGIFFGVFAIIFIVVIQFLVSNYTSGDSPVSFFPISFFEYFIVLLSVLYVVLSIIVIAFINKRRNKKINAANWKQNSKRILTFLILFISIVSSLIYTLVDFGFTKHTIALFLTTYGLFLFIINKFTQKSIYGFYFILLGIGTYLFPEFQFILFAIGFGIGHLLYGISYYILKDQFSNN